MRIFAQIETSQATSGRCGETAKLRPAAAAAAGRRCWNCAGEFEAIDITATARAVMRCVKEMRGRFGKTRVAYETERQS